MRHIILSLFILFSLNLIAQKTDVLTVHNFWNTNIAEIIRLDKEKIIEHTNFPLDGSWGYAIGLESGPDEWTDDDYKNNLDKIFNDEMRVMLRGKTVNDLVHFEDEEGVVNFIIELKFVSEEEDLFLESSTIMYFKQFDGIWKLFQIEYAG